MQAGNLVTAGKNLLSSSTFVESPPNDVILNFSVPAGTYTLSCYNAEDWWTGITGEIWWYIHDGDNRYIKPINMGSPSVGSRSHTTFTLPVSGDFILHTYKVGISKMATDLQLELGSTATAYEPPNVTETALPTIEPLTSVNDYADELVVDGSGSVSVNRIIQTVDIATADFSGASFSAASGGAPAYIACNLGLTPFGSASELQVSSSSSSSSSRYTYVGTWTNAPDGVTSGCYRTWNSYVFWDREFTDKEQAIGLIQGGGGKIMALVPETAEEVGTIDVPALPAPTFNAYPTGGYVPGDTSVEYERDVNIAYEQLEAKIAALTVAQATS